MVNYGEVEASLILGYHIITYLHKSVRQTSIFSALIKWPIIDGFQILRCPKNCIEILPKTIILELSKAKK